MNNNNNQTQSSGFGGTGFGGGNANTNSTAFGGGFGSQAKPAGSLFGGTTGATGGFGSGNTGIANNTNNQAGASTFGTGGLFGTNSAANNQNTGGFGSNAGGTNSLFGQNASNPAEQKPNSLFGGTSAATSNSLFGNPWNSNAGQNNQQPSTSLFGGLGNVPSNNNNSGGGSLFGGLGKPAASSATASTGLFGSATGALGGGGLLGNNASSQPQQNPGSNLFGGAAQQPKPGGLFGNLGSAAAGIASNNSGSIFGGTNAANQTTGGSLFGGSQSQPNPSTASIFSSSTQPNQFQTQAFTTSISDGSAFGNQPLFASLNSTPVQAPGPLATPLSTSQKQKSSAIYPPYRRNPFDIPRTPLSQGYGLSYSRYGTPSSAMSSMAGTPRNNGVSLLGNSLRKPLGKSTSMINLGATYHESEGVFSPNAFSAGSRRSGSMRRLMIDRNVRSDLFSPNDTPKALPSTEPQDTATKATKSLIKKKVSFEASTGSRNGDQGGNIFAQANGSMMDYSSTDSTQTLSNGVQDDETSRSQPKSSGVSRQSAADSGVDKVTSKELTIVLEEDSQVTPSNPKKRAEPNGPLEDQGPGGYWMHPSLQELRKLSRDRLKKVNLTVGRHNCGEVKFNEPVDLTGIKLEEIMGTIVDFQVRKCTVYPDNVSKPTPGRGLNIPATIELQHSGPSTRNKKRADAPNSGLLYDRHVVKLKRIPDTRFISFDGQSGLWKFAVQHFTTYGIDEDESELPDEDMDKSWPEDSSELSPPPSTLEAKSLTPRDSSVHNQDFMGDDSDGYDADQSPEDTFGYKKNLTLPGAFDHEGHGLVSEVSGRPDAAAKPDQDMTFERQDSETDGQSSKYNENLRNTPGADEKSTRRPSITRNPSRQPSSTTQEVDQGDQSLAPYNQSTSKGAVNGVAVGFSQSFKAVPFSQNEDWSMRLKQSVSPSKQSRRALLKEQEQILEDLDQFDSGTVTKSPPHHDSNGFATSIDIMNSLYGRSQSRSSTKTTILQPQKNGFHWSLLKTANFDRSTSSLPEEEREYHEAFKPSWSMQEELIVLSKQEKALPTGQRLLHSSPGLLAFTHEAEVSQSCTLRFGRLNSEDIAMSSLIREQLAISEISHDGYAPVASVSTAKILTVSMSENLVANSPRAAHEKAVWSLLDALTMTKDASPASMKDALSEHWASLVSERALAQVDRAKSHEERALAFLSAHMVEEACSTLMDGGNYHLATMVARIGTDRLIMDDIKEQLDRFRKMKILSEFNDPIRALYELLAGNAGSAEGQQGAPEDRVQAFTISHRFDMDWKQAFGLHLWYGRSGLSSLAEIIGTFQECTERLSDYPRPTPWYDIVGSSREHDILWGIVRLFGHKSHSRHGKHDFDLTEVISVSTYSPNTFDSRLAWQVFHYLDAKDVLHPHATRSMSRQLDQLSTDVATQLSWSESWAYSFLPLLYLTDPDLRRNSIVTALEAQAHRLDSSKREFRFLIDQLKIPAAWIWRARAVFCQSCNDFEEVAKCYIRCDDQKGVEQALEVVAATLGPQAVVYGDLQPLIRTLTALFEQGIDGNSIGDGQMYADYIRLVDYKENRKRESGSSEIRDHTKGDMEMIAKRLAQKLREKRADTGCTSYEATVEQVALGEMSRAVGRILLDHVDSVSFDPLYEPDSIRVYADGGYRQSSMSREVLGLPITGIGYTETAIDLGLHRYKQLLVG